MSSMRYRIVKVGTVIIWKELYIRDLKCSKDKGKYITSKENY